MFENMPTSVFAAFFVVGTVTLTCLFLAIRVLAA